MAANALAEDFEPKISLEKPVDDYKKLMQEKVQVNVCVEDDVLKRNYKKISAAARETIWKLLFSNLPTPWEVQARAGEFLDAYKGDACFYEPYEYNDWVVPFRDELLKNNMTTFWREYVVKKELGLCWARDSDFFDDDEDPEPEAFYEHAGCVAPFSKQDFDVTISLEHPLKDYKKLLDEKVRVDIYVPDEVIQFNYKKISQSARDTVWKLLFELEQTEENQSKAAALLEKHKGDACFYVPWEYNDWIPSVRDELLKRNMLDFWRNEIVQKELGLCWARDSDYFHDMDDPAPEAFYKFAGCIAPFSKVAENGNGDSPVASGMEFKPLISWETPLDDYKKLIREYVHVNQPVPDSILNQNYRKIAARTRALIWQMLFVTRPPVDETLAKAAALLKKHKADACFYGPYDYNDWIVSVRDELLRKKMIDFWRDEIVRNELGPCWAKDCDFFDDRRDPEPEEFYRYAGCVAPFSKDAK